MTDGRGDDRIVVFVMNFAPFSDLFKLSQLRAESLGEVVHDGGFFGNDECFSHGGKFWKGVVSEVGLGREFHGLQGGKKFSANPFCLTETVFKLKFMVKFGRFQDRRMNRKPGSGLTKRRSSSLKSPAVTAEEGSPVWSIN